ncbi:MAG TPA: quinone-dependent dihydroorotate dehydrogenase [Bacteroidia bacterium]
MFKLIRSFLFMMSAEKAHYVTLNILSLLVKTPVLSQILNAIYGRKKTKSVEFAGLVFPNNVGLAAGFDKNARYLHVMKALGFGHVEIGTVTPLPQDGNEKPRLFRLVKDEAIINRMGFNNDGADVIAERLKNRPADLIVGGNIGKNKVTPNENALDDYNICFNKLYPYVDYFTVNVSSPNTPGLRALQDKGPLKEILDTLMNNRRTKVESGMKQLPIFLKIAPDLTDSQLDDIVELCAETGIDGLVATNTTISREHLKTPKNEVDAIGAGGLSGKPLKERSDEVLRYLCEKLNGKTPVIGVGGIASAADAKDKFKAGAGLVQVYSGFIYEGPAMVQAIAANA